MSNLSLFIATTSISVKIFLLFYIKNLLFLFYTINLQKNSYQIIYKIPFFIKIILFYIFIIISLAHTRPHHHTKHHFPKHSFFFSFFLLSSFFFYDFSSSASSFSFSFAFLTFFLSSSSISSLKKKSFSFSPSLSLSNWCSLQIWKKKSLYQASMAQYIHTLSLSHGGDKLGFWADLYFAKWVFCCVLFWVDFALSWF